MSQPERVQSLTEPAPNAAPFDEWVYRVVAALILGLALPEIAGIRRYFSFESPVYWLSACGLGVSLYLVGWLLHTLTYRFHCRVQGQPAGSTADGLIMLIACSSFALGITFIQFILWFRWFDLPIDWRGMICVGLFQLLMVLVMTKLYQGVYTQASIMHAELRANRFRGEEAMALSASQAYRQAPESILGALRALRALIGKNQDLALQAARSLATVHRYILGGTWRDLVPLRDELELLECHISLLEIRFAVRLILQIEFGEQSSDHYLIVPVSLHQLLEDALLFGHLQGSVGTPQAVRIDLYPGSLRLSYACTGVVSSELENNRLDALNERVAAIIGKPLQLEITPAQRLISIPLYSLRD